jgi:hypothetical protein
MKYQVKCRGGKFIYMDTTDNVLFESESMYECQDWMDYKELTNEDAWIDRVIECRECSNEGEEQYDAHGISTGYWCHECYESDKYPYRKDAYPTIETHGYGERLSEDY